MVFVFKGTSNYTCFLWFQVVRLPKSRFGQSFNTVQRYVFLFYLTNF